jgi:hypothetical protein
MDETEFWDLIDQAREAAAGDTERQSEALCDLLRGRRAADLEDFAWRFWTLHAQAYRWDLWDAGTLINGGMSDDGFMDFRSWLISRGQHVYDRALVDPDSLADIPEAVSGHVEAGRFAGAVHRAYEETHGRGVPARGVPEPADPVGEPWDEDDLPRRFPRLQAKAASNVADAEGRGDA